MKVLFIVTSYATCYFIYSKFKATYDHNHDTFRIEFLLIPAVILSLLINHKFTVLEVSSGLVLALAWVSNREMLIGFVDLQYLFGIGRNFAAIVHGEQDG